MKKIEDDTIKSAREIAIAVYPRLNRHVVSFVGGAALDYDAYLDEMEEIIERIILTTNENRK